MTMADLRERFQTADRLIAPDLWPMVEERLDPAAPDRSLRSVGSIERARPTTTRKLLTIAAAFLIVALAFGWLLRSIARTEPIPVVQPPVSVFAPIHGWIAYSDGDSMQLMAADPTGALPPRPVFAGSSDSALWGGANAIVWAPDGDHLFRPDGAVVGPDGAATQVIPSKTPAGKATFVSTASFSPDGRRILYTAYDGSLQVADLDGGPPQEIASAKANPGYYYAWSPDGAQIAYVMQEGRDWAIGTMASDGSDQHVLLDLSDQPVGELAPLVWSPDGSTLAFSLNPTCCDENQGEIGVVRADGTGFELITPNDGSWGPSWSPDGQRIAFIRDGRIFTVAPDGTDVQKVPGAQPLGYTLGWNPAG